MKYFNKIFLILSFFAFCAFAQDNDAKYKNFSYFYVFGPEGVDEYGKNDLKQLIYLRVPNALASFELKVKDPGSTSKYEQKSGDGVLTTTKFTVIGGPQATSMGVAGNALKSFTFTDESEGELVSLGSYKTSDGSREGAYHVFKILVEGVSGQRINLFDIETSSDSIDLFTYKTAIHFLPKSGLDMAFNVEVPDGTTKVIETNYDIAESHIDKNLTISFMNKSLKASDNDETVSNTLSVDKGGFYDYVIHATKKSQFNNSMFFFKDQDGKYLRVFHNKVVVPAKPKAPDMHSCEINTSLVKMVKTAPAKSTVGDSYEIVMEITAKQDVKDVIVSGLKPNDAVILNSSPRPKVDGKNISWLFAQMSKGETKEITLKLQPEKEGTVGFCSGIMAIPKVCKTTVIGKAELKIVKSGPATALLGSTVNYKIKVTNTGTNMAKKVKVVDTVPKGLQYANKSQKLTYEVGDLKPGESKEITVPLKAIARGKHCNQAEASAANAKAVKDEACTVIVQPGLKVVKTGTKLQFVGKRATYKIVVSNTGDTVLNGVITTDTLPQGVKVVDSGGGVLRGNVITWQTGTLKSGQEKAYNVTVISVTTGELCNVAAVKDSSGLNDSSKACTVWKGHPALLLEVIDTEDPLLPGGETTYVVRITNQGTAQDTKVKFTAEFPAEISPSSISGSTKGEIKGKSVVVQPFAILKPKGVIEWKIKAKAIKTGDARIKIKMSSDLLKTPVNEEESTHVY